MSKESTIPRDRIEFVFDPLVQGWWAIDTSKRPAEVKGPYKNTQDHARWIRIDTRE